MGHKVQQITPPKPLTLYLDHYKALVEIESDSFYGESFIPTITLTPKKEYFVVYVLYTTGDSNGRDPGRRCEVIDAYEDYDFALEMARNISFNDQTDQRFSDQAGQPKKLVLYANGTTMRDKHLPWSGYFESLEEVHVLRFIFDGTPSHTIIDRYTKF